MYMTNDLMHFYLHNPSLLLTMQSKDSDVKTMPHNRTKYLTFYKVMNTQKI